MIEFIIKIPEETVASGLFEDAATAVGWSPTVTGEDGTPVPNPVSAIAACLYNLVIPIIKERAAAIRLSRQVDTLRDQIQTDIDNAGDQWQQALQEAQ